MGNLAFKLRQGHSRQTSDLAGELFGREAVMAAPTKRAQATHLTGEYHTHPHPHKCRTYWHTKVNAKGEAVGMGKARYEAWRNVPLKNGGVLHCGACFHERVLGFCKQIERVSLLYRDWEALRYTTVPTSEYKKLRDRICKHNQRHDRQIDYTSFPQANGQTIVLHDAPADYLDGQTLPTERPKLYALISSWARTPKGKRAGRGFSTWGEQQDRGQDDEAHDGDEGDGQAQQAGGRDEESDIVARIYGQHYNKVAMLVARYLDTEPGAKGMRFPSGFMASEFVELLDAAGVDYAIDGEIPGVIDNTDRPSSNSVKSDIDPQATLPFDETGGQGGDKSDREAILDRRLEVLTA